MANKPISFISSLAIRVGWYYNRRNFNLKKKQKIGREKGSDSDLWFAKRLAEAAIVAKIAFKAC